MIVAMGYEQLALTVVNTENDEEEMGSSLENNCYCMIYLPLYFCSALPGRFVFHEAYSNCTPAFITCAGVTPLLK